MTSACAISASTSRPSARSRTSAWPTTTPSRRGAPPSPTPSSATMLSVSLISPTRDSQATRSHRCARLSSAAASSNPSSSTGCACPSVTSSSLQRPLPRASRCACSNTLLQPSTRPLKRVIGARRSCPSVSPHQPRLPCCAGRSVTNSRWSASSSTTCSATSKICTLMRCALLCKTPFRAGWPRSWRWDPVERARRPRSGC
mmetsp:Transcript_18773/g.59920  ORF Transcript_18773/g.59920 Transcript_18773/m.59920 type:complete len:201 (+) Transcript_18773:404-1006(+)